MGDHLIKKGVRTIWFVFSCAPGATFFKLLESAVVAVMAPLTIWLTQKLVDNVMVSNGLLTNSTIWLCVAALLFTMLFSASGNTVGALLNMSLKRKVSIAVTDQIADKYHKIDYSCYEKEEIYAIINRMGDRPEEALLDSFHGTANVLVCLISIVGNALIFSQLGIIFSVIYLLCLLPLFIFEYKCCKIMADMFQEQSEDERKMNYYRRLFSEKSSVFELKLFWAVGYMMRKWKDTTNKVMRYRVRTTYSAQKYMLFSSMMYLIWTGYLLYTIIHSGISGTISVGLCTALIAALASIVANVESFIWGVESLGEKLVHIGYIDSFFMLPETPAYGDKIIEKKQFVICFEHVTFTYPGAEIPSLLDVNISFHSEEHVAIVGENGAGKSTLIKLICRLYRPDSGRITINGISLWDISEDALRSMFSVIFQDFGSYQLTLRENVAFGAIEYSNDDERIISALKKVSFPDEKTNLADSYGKLDENGVDLSGGEWQKIAIARAYISDRQFLILDEPTAALDPMAESAMYNSFLSLMCAKGCLIVSHRLASARMADRIIVLHDGRIAEDGTHDMLIKKGKIYKKMWLLQSELYREGDISEKE